MSVHAHQYELFDAVLDEYAGNDTPIDNQSLYERLASKGFMDQDNQRIFGNSGPKRSEVKYRIRWIQQVLKQEQSIERVGPGLWQVTRNKKAELTQINAGKHLVAMSTSLGVMVWSRQQGLLDRLRIDEPIELVFTSTPYPIVNPRAYGGYSEQELIDFICDMLEPIRNKMVPGGNIALNLGLTHEHQSPAESIYIERLIVALYDRLGLKKMKTIIWQSNKNPVSSGPFATRFKQTLLNTYEPILWFCADPDENFVDIRSIEEAHSEAHKRFVERGGVKSDKDYADGAYRRRAGDYSTLNQGRLPRDVWNISNYCAEGRQVNEFAQLAGLPAHAAKMPKQLAHRVVKLLSRRGGLVFDPCAGTMTIPSVCEELGRSWVACEQFLEYIQQSFARFSQNVWINPALKRPVIRGSKEWPA